MPRPDAIDVVRAAFYEHRTGCEVCRGPLDLCEVGRAHFLQLKRLLCRAPRHRKESSSVAEPPAH